MKRRKRKTRLQIGDKTETVAYAADTIMTMLARESITVEQAAAGRRFRSDFNEANCTNVKATDYGAPKGCHGSIRPTGDAPEVSWARTVQPALDALSGPRRAAAWHILGMGRSISDFAVNIGWDGIPQPRKKAAHELRTALGILATHYGSAGPRLERSPGN